ncbi:uncharacterized protein V6R79_022481 [Siganus canaliculatus]
MRRVSAGHELASDPEKQPAKRALEHKQTIDDWRRREILTDCVSLIVVALFTALDLKYKILKCENSPGSRQENDVKKQR